MYTQLSLSPHLFKNLAVKKTLITLPVMLAEICVVEHTISSMEVIMFGSYILDIAIGLVFVYMLLSLLCSTINER